VEDCLDTKTVIGALALFWWLASGLSKLLKKLNKDQGQVAAVPADQEVWEEEEELATTRQVVAQEAQEEAPTDVLAGFRAEWQERCAAVERRTNEMSATFVHERPNRPFLELLDGHVPEQVRHARAELKDASTLTVETGAARIQDAEYILEVVAYLGEQRRNEILVPMLGDADRLAESCYRPVLTFANSQGLGIASNTPVSVLSDFDLSIWTGLIPTSIAPIFLPPGFFDRVSWWPAVPHEIGHDFYASIDGLDASLREELGLPSEREGRRVISASRSVPASEIQRVFGAWLEELFCDVFATLMTGPGYVVSMLELFAAPHDPRAITTVDVTSGGYDVHPPRHLRFTMACEILGMLGFNADVEELAEEWQTVHGGAENLQEIRLATDNAVVAFPVEPFMQVTNAIAERLYRGPLEALRGRGMSGISGLDYGPHRHNEVKRARDALLAGEVPAARDSRAVVGGAALAAHADPDSEPRIMELARHAILAKGTGESRHSIHHQHRRRASLGGLGDIDPSAIVQALVVGEIMKRPGARH